MQDFVIEIQIGNSFSGDSTWAFDYACRIEQLTSPHAQKPPTNTQCALCNDGSTCSVCSIELARRSILIFVDSSITHISRKEIFWLVSHYDKGLSTKINSQHINSSVKLWHLPQDQFSPVLIVSNLKNGLDIHHCCNTPKSHEDIITLRLKTRSFVHTRVKLYYFLPSKRSGILHVFQ